MSTNPNRNTDLSLDEIGVLVGDVEDARDRIRDAMEEIRQAARLALAPGDMHRLERGVLAHIECALTRDHQYLGGNMFTLDDTLDEMRDAASPRCHACGGERFERPTEAPDLVVCVECEAVQ